MAVYTLVSAESMAQFLSRYDVGDLRSFKGIAEGVENSNYLVETTHGKFILTLYEKRVDPGDLPFFLSLLDHLAAKGMAVPPAIKDREGQQLQQLEGRSACLIQFLEGVSLSHPTPVQAHAAGTAMGRMHRSLSDFGMSRENTMGADHWHTLYEQCGHALNDISPGLYDRLGRQLDDVTARWPEQGDMPRSVIHADLFPDNVLMLGDELTGLIDFYFACSDFRAYDLAVMHSAWTFSDDGSKADWQIGDALVAGYQSVIPLEQADREQLTNLARGACIRFLLSRAWDWLNTPADALVTRKDPMAYWRRLEIYNARQELLA